MYRTESVDDYLKAIYKVSAGAGRATTSALARHLGIRPASVTGMLLKLASERPRSIRYAKHRGATLTSQGRRRALEVIRHHRLVELFLCRVMGYGWDEVDTEAERLEHHISEAFEDRIAHQLGNPDTDPHGHLIPHKDGSMPKRAEVCLLDLPIGARAAVSSVSDADPALLRYFSVLAIAPGVRLVVLDRGPFDGPLTVRLQGASAHVALSTQVASKIYVVLSPDGR